MQSAFGVLFVGVTLCLVGWLFHSIVFGQKDDWQAPLGLFIFFWAGSGILISILKFAFGLKL